MIFEKYEKKSLMILEKEFSSNFLVKKQFLLKEKSSFPPKSESSLI